MVTYTFKGQSLFYPIDFLFTKCYRQDLPNNADSCKDNVNWNWTEELLEPAEADVLEIFDW